MKKIVNEFVIWTVMLVPFIFMISVWDALPYDVPTHFGVDGVADGWMSKPYFVCFLSALIIGLYVLFLIIPKLDTKKKIDQMGKKYYQLRLLMSIFFSLISCVNIYFAVEGSLDNPQLLVALIGILFAVIGNYSQTIRTNYYIGFCTPWTLENEQVWKDTHLIGGRVWVVGGFFTILWSLFVKNNQVLFNGLIVIIALLVIIPSLY